MKKVFLLLGTGLFAFQANAQSVNHRSITQCNPDHQRISKFTEAEKVVASRLRHNAEKTTSTCFWTENFGSGNYTTLPTGWTAGTNAGSVGTWRWSHWTSGSSFPMTNIASTTAANGWMIFDSDSLGGAATGGPVPAGWLQSPAINCAAYTTVKLSFQENYRQFYDSCFVQVSTTSSFAAGTYTSYPVLVNNNLPINSGTTNPQTIGIDISATAASHATVYLRFVYMGPAGGGYSWMIDDICMSPLDPHDVSIGSSFLYQFEPYPTCFESSIFSTPLEFTDSLSPVTMISNNGSSNETNVVTTATIYQGTTSVYTATATTPSLPYRAADSLVQMNNRYKPNAVGAYTVTFSTALTGDANMADNVDTTTFAVTDTTWMVNHGLISGGYYLHNPTGTSGPVSYFNGARFDVPASCTGDTLTGFGVAFEGGTSGSVPTGTGKVSVQLYSITQDTTVTAWTYIGRTYERNLVAADISTSASAIVWADFRIDPNSGAGNGYADFIMQPGKTYAGVAQVNGVTTKLVIYATTKPNATGFSGYFGQSYASNDDGGTGFGATRATGLEDVPMVRAYFGNVPHVNSVVELTSGSKIGEAYPNPSNTEFSVPFTMVQDTKVTVTLINEIGQVVATQTVNAGSNQSERATFNTAALTSGVYIYTVEANGARVNGRITVAH